MPYGYGGGFINPYTMIILILIVLQWFRVGVGGAGVGPTPGLLECGGLFIIAIFLLVYCACGRGPVAPVAPVAGVRYC